MVAPRICLSGVKKVIVGTTHTTMDGKLKLVKKCTLPLTAPECVCLIVTDIAAIEVTPGGLVLKKLVPGCSGEDVQTITEPRLTFTPDLKEIQLTWRRQTCQI